MVMEIVKWLLANWMVVVSGVLGMIMGALMVLRAIPGIQPGEKMLEKAAGALQKIVKK